MSQNRISIKFLICGLVLLALASACGGPLNDAKTCSFRLESQDILPLSGRQVIEMEGPIPVQCQTLTRENSGKLEVRIRLSGPKNESIFLGDAQAGLREKAFDSAVYSLKAGSLDAVFTSLSEPGWSVPWADNPSAFKVALYAPLSTAQANLPKSAQIILTL